MKIASLLIWFFAMLCASSAQQTSILVQPVRLDLQPKPGERVEVPVSVRNLSKTHPAKVQARLWELYQTEEGGLTVMDPEVVANPPPPPSPSCLPFTKLDREDFEIPPEGVQIINVKMQVPMNARGFYCGCAIVQTVPERKPGTIAIRIRFLVPILVQVYGTASTRRIEVGVPTMEFAPKNAREPVGTIFKIPIRNAGESMTRVNANLTVYSSMNDRLRKVTSVSFKERTLLPHAQAVLAQKTMTRLPKGKYKLFAEVRLEGSAPFRSSGEFDYEGDPEMKSAVFASELEMSPETLEIEGAPGAMRSTSLLVKNTGTEPVQLKAGAGVPLVLQGVAAGNRVGEELSCPSWVSFGSTAGTVKPGSERRINVLVRIPREGVKYSHYYARLLLTALSPEGQPIGTVEGLLAVKIQNAEVKAELTPSGRVTVTKTGKSEYNFVMRFANLGSVHLDLKPSASLMDAQSSRVLKELKPEEEGSGYLLPLGTRAYSYTVNFQDVPPGKYALRFVVEYEKNRAISTVMVRVVSAANGERSVEVVEQINS